MRCVYMFDCNVKKRSRSSGTHKQTTSNSHYCEPKGGSADNRISQQKNKKKQKNKKGWKSTKKKSEKKN